MSFKHIPLGSPEVFNVIVEISKGSPNKYEYDEALDIIKLDFVFKNGFVFPFDYGYIPQTRGGDGDTLDVIILTPHPLETGTIVEAQAIGMIEMLDRGEQDNKIIAIPLACEEYKDIQSIKDLPETQLEAFRRAYKELGIQKNKIVEIKAFLDKDRAIQEIKNSIRI